MKNVAIVIGIVLVALAAWVGVFYYNNLRGVGPAFGPIPDITRQTVKKGTMGFGPVPGTPMPSENTTGLPLTIPEGFAIGTVAKNVPDARVLLWDSAGRLLVSSPDTGLVMAINLKDGKETGRMTVASGLKQPHGMDFHDGKLYIAETNQVTVYDYDVQTARATNKKKIIDLPAGGGHFSRTIKFGPDNKLYISVGSSCNVCIEGDWRRAKILVANADGTDLKAFGSGLRNAVFFTWSPLDGRMWATNMGRDLLGDNTPPETVNIVTAGKDFGWPFCYGHRIWDQGFDPSKKAEEFCKTTEPPHIEYQAHSAPLGLAFIPDSWPEEYRRNLLVAFHGSWNRSVPTGYKVMRFVLDEKGNYLGVSDFVTGWLTDDGALGRPVDLLFDDQGALYISDDKSGTIYQVRPQYVKN